MVYNYESFPIMEKSTFYTFKEGIYLEKLLYLLGILRVILCV